MRDADILHLYKRAGFERFLLGMENTDQATLDLVKKGAATREDREAIRLLRQHDILSLTTWVADFGDMTHRRFLTALKQLLSYDPDQITTMFVTPHRWTPFYAQVADRRVIQPDQSKWDYRHQVLTQRYLSPLMMLAWVKAIEVLVQTRPKALWRVWFHPDRGLRHGMRWYTRMGRRVWFHEIVSFLVHDRRLRSGPTLAGFWGMPQAASESALRVSRLHQERLEADVRAPQACVSTTGVSVR